MKIPHRDGSESDEGCADPTCSLLPACAGNHGRLTPCPRCGSKSAPCACPTRRPPCADHTPSWFVGHWREWHRGHGCDRDDGKPRSPDAASEIAQHAANTATGFLTDAELRFLRAATTSGDELRVRTIDELAARRGGDARESVSPAELRSLRGSASARRDDLLSRAISELTVRRKRTEDPHEV